MLNHFASFSTHIILYYLSIISSYHILSPCIASNIFIMTTSNHGALSSTFPRYGNSTVYRHRHRDTNRTEITYHVSLHHVSLHHVISRIGQVIPSHHMNHIATYHVQTQQVPKLQTCFKASYWTNPAALLIPTVRSWLFKKGIAALGHFGSLGSFDEGRVKMLLGN